jgi:hypothetical protein
MTQEEIIEMAQQCGLIGMRPHLDGIYFEAVEAFAKLVDAKATAKEREACAKECEKEADFFDNNEVHYEVCAKAIRARGNA